MDAKETSVVNVRVKHIRPKHQNLKAWMDVEGHVYIGRVGIVFIDGVRFPQTGSLWGNPFKVGKDGTLEDVLLKYETYIRQKINTNDKCKAELLAMRGKSLGCWCKPEKCHGDILVKLIEEYSR